MAQVRCIEAINGYEVNDIIEVGDGIAFSLRGDSGALVIKDFGKGDTIIFVVDDAIDTIGDSIRVQAPDSLHRFFTFDLTIPEEPDPTPTEVDCLNPLTITEVDPENYKVFIDGVTYVQLEISYTGEIEFSTKKTGAGGTNGLNESGFPQTWLTIPKVSGKHNVPLPSTGLPEAIFTRKKGCTGQGVFGNYVTFTADGDDPIESGGGTGGTGGIGTGLAVVPANGKPRGVTVWGFFFGRFREPFNGEAEHIHKTHYAEQSAMSDPEFKNSRPFFSIDGTYTKDGSGNLQIVPGATTVPVGIYSNIAKTHIVQNRYADTDWQGGAKEMDWCIEYMVEAGLQYFKFEYYANGYDGAGMRTLYEQCTNKRGIKAAYTVGQFGGDRNNYDDPNDDYRKNLEHFTWAMGQPWYQQIDGKPLIFLFKDPYDHPEDTYPQQKFKEEFALELGRIRDRYAAKYGSGGIYEVYCMAGMSSDYTFLESQGMDALTWYYTFDEQASGTHNMNSPNTAAYNNTVALNAAGKQVAPSLNIALYGMARAKYPGSTYQHGTPNDSYGINYNPVWEGSYYNPPTASGLEKIAEDMDALSNLTNVKTVICATFDELSEGGPTCLMPKRRANGTIDKTTVTAFKNVFNPTYPSAGDYVQFE